MPICPEKKIVHLVNVHRQTDLTIMVVMLNMLSVWNMPAMYFTQSSEQPFEVDAFTIPI